MDVEDSIGATDGETADDAARKAEWQRLAAEAWGYVQVFARQMDRRYPGIDFGGAIAVRIVEGARRFDATKGSSLSTWAHNQAIYACRDAWRAAIPLGFRRREGAPHIYSHDAMQAALRERVKDPHKDVDYLAITDPVAEWEQDEAADHMLRGMRAVHRQIVRGHVIDGVPLGRIADGLGITESRASQIRAQSLAWLREVGRTG